MLTISFIVHIFTTIGIEYIHPTEYGQLIFYGRGFSYGYWSGSKQIKEDELSLVRAAVYLNYFRGVFSW